MNIKTSFISVIAILALAACETVPQAKPAQPVASKPAPTGAPFSPVVEAGGVLYLAGHLGRNPETRAYDPNIAAQTTQTLKNIGHTLSGVGANMSDIVRCQVFMTDITGFREMNRAYRQFFPTNPPARTTVEVSGLAAPYALIEIECTAVN